MTDLSDVYQQLTAPFEPGEVKHKPARGGGGKQLAYIEAPAVMNRLDQVVGPHNWSVRTDVIDADTGAVKVSLTVLGITRENYGDPNNAKANVGPQVFKEAFSDGLKRAAMLFGIGRYLWEDGADHAGAGSQQSKPATSQGNLQPSQQPRQQPAPAPAQPGADAAFRARVNGNGQVAPQPPQQQQPAQSNVIMIGDMAATPFTSKAGKQSYKSIEQCPMHPGEHFFAVVKPDTGQLSPWSHKAGEGWCYGG